MLESRAIGRLIEALRRLPGVGPKSARRMAYHMLERDRDGGRELSKALVDAMEVVGHCKSCHNLTEDEICSICASTRRDHSLLCIVESPTDLQSLEQSGIYNGRYFVLMGHLSPLDGIGPEQLGIDRLESLLDTGEIAEVVLATNLTVEGEATAHYVGELVRSRGIKATRIAYGVPVGGELEYIDKNTLTRAFTGRQEV
ncbi:MAG: recombination mediator RecR [Gammaproteobacteria bacterium]|nr:recombination mediator RecR [Gammaproteobacteria bacterium]